jgi:DNA-3-methyladenine glycosylase
MGIDQRHNQADLQGKEIWIEDAPELPGSQIEITTRIGVEYAGEDALLPRRFYDRLSPFVSHPIKGRISIK